MSEQIDRREIKDQVIAVFDRWHGIGVPDTAGELGGVMEIVETLLRRAEQAEAERDRLRKRLNNAVQTSLAKTDEINRLDGYLAAATEAARQAEVERDRLRDLVTEILTHFHERGHPGREAVRTCWIDADTATQWRRAATSNQAAKEGK